VSVLVVADKQHVDLFAMLLVLGAVLGWRNRAFAWRSGPNDQASIKMGAKAIYTTQMWKMTPALQWSSEERGEFGTMTKVLRKELAKTRTTTTFGGRLNWFAFAMNTIDPSTPEFRLMRGAD
jgi:hypothetical protein